MRMSLWPLAVLLLALAPPRLAAQSAAQWHDELVEHMMGSWTLGGQVMGLGRSS
jgi:hypothetical protein